MIQIRRATIEDASDILEWRNDPDTVAMSKTPNVVGIESHMSWFEKAVIDPNRIIFVATEHDRRLGMVRFDKSNDGWLVSINLAPAERRKGYSLPFLMRCIAEVRPARLTAEIKKTNVPSIRIFERCGFRLIGEEGDFQHWVLPL